MDAPYQRLAAALRHLIVGGEWPPGTPIPSGRQLAEQHHVTRRIAERAIAVLRAEHLIEGRRGARLQVAYPPAVRTLVDPHADWPYLIGDTEAGTCRADPVLAQRLRVPVRCTLHRYRAECLDPDGRPAMLVTTWRRGTRRRVWVCATVEAMVDLLAADEAHALGLVAGVTAIRLHRTRYDKDGLPVETADLVLPADRWRVRL